MFALQHSNDCFNCRKYTRKYTNENVFSKHVNVAKYMPFIGEAPVRSAIAPGVAILSTRVNLPCANGRHRTASVDVPASPPDCCMSTNHRSAGIPGHHRSACTPYAVANRCAVSAVVERCAASTSRSPRRLRRTNRRRSEKAIKTHCIIWRFEYGIRMDSYSR